MCETGATRNYEPWKDEKLSKAELEQQKQEAAEYNPMMALEDRTRESKREMDILDGLDELRTRNARSER